MLLSLSLLLCVVTRTCQRPSCICTVLYLRAVYTQAWERHLLDNLRIFGFGYQSTPRENQEVRPWTNFRQYCAPASTQEILLSNKRRLTSVSRLTYQEARVTEVREVEKTGFFSPFTVCGDIEVVSNEMNSGVIASIYSDWFLEGLGVDPSTIPGIYHMLLTPLRLVHDKYPEWTWNFASYFQDSEKSLHQEGVGKLIAAGIATTLSIL